MIIYKDKGLIYSEYVLQDIAYNTDLKDITCRVETFYNCREMGYVFIFHNEEYNKHLLIWVYAHRNSNEPTIAYDTGKTLPTQPANMFTEEVWHFKTDTFDTIEKASERVQEIISNYFEYNKEVL